MDKKIILSVLIVALIGIVAATYQINTGQDVLNPLSSVSTEEESPVTEVLSAPETQQDAQAKAEAQQKADAQAQAQAQQQADAQAKKQADAQAQSDAQSNSQDTSGSQSTQAGSTSQSTSLIGSGDTITVPSSGSSGSSDSNSGSSDNTGTTDNAGSTDNSGSNNNGGSNNNAGTTDNGGSTDNGGDQQPTSTNTDDTQTSETISDQVKSTIRSILEPNIDSSILTLDVDNAKLVNNEYQVPAYDQSKNFAGTFYVNVDSGAWHYIDKNGNYQGPETPDVDNPNNGLPINESQ